MIIQQRAYYWLRARGITPNWGLTQLAMQPARHQPRLIVAQRVDTETGEIKERKL